MQIQLLGKIDEEKGYRKRQWWGATKSDYKTLIANKGFVRETLLSQVNENQSSIS